MVETTIKTSNNSEIVNSDRRAFMKKTAIAALAFGVAGSVFGLAEATKDSAANEGKGSFVFSF